MWKEFNDGKKVSTEVVFSNEKFNCEVFEEQSCDDAKVDYAFNLIAIEFNTPTPFNTEDRVSKFKGNNHIGYIVDISKNKIEDIYLLVENLGFGETDTVKFETEEYDLVLSILKQVSAIN